jgi:glyoxylase-like metal-dependent hydrolase (beta-lactamase superfamily II)
MFQYRILETGFFWADGGAMFGAIPKRAWKRKYPSDAQNCCCLAMNCLLAWDDDRVVLLDTGAGIKDLGKLAYYRFQKMQELTGLIRSHGFEAEAVTDVVLSHLHFDHCGGCTYPDESGSLKVTFPNAKHWVGKSQWENYLHPNDLEKDSFRPEDMMPVFESGLIRLVDDDFDLFDDFQLKLFDGHTKGQLASFLQVATDEILSFPGDVIPTRAHLSDQWISAYDVEPLESLAAKIKLKKDLKEKKATIVFYHDSTKA